LFADYSSGVRSRLFAFSEKVCYTVIIHD
jgi:hypothetical protein